MAALRRPRIGKILLLLAFLGLTIVLIRLALYQVAARHLQDWARSIPGCTGIRYDRLTLTFFSIQGHLRNATLLFENGGDPITAQTIHVRRFRPGGALPRDVVVDLTGVRVDAAHPLLAPLAQTLDALGYALLEGDIGIEWERRGEKQEAWTVDLTLRMAAAGELALSARLAKINAEGVLLALENPLNWLLVLPAVEIVALHGDYRDQGLFDRALAAEAREHGQPPEVMRDIWQRQLQARSRAEEDANVRAVWEALAAYVRQPGRIVILTELPQPVPVGQIWWLRQPRDVIRRLALACRAA